MHLPDSPAPFLDHSMARNETFSQLLGAALTRVSEVMGLSPVHCDFLPTNTPNRRQLLLLLHVVLLTGQCPRDLSFTSSCEGPGQVTSVPWACLLI